MEDTRKNTIGGGWLRKSISYEDAAPLTMSMLCLVVIMSVWTSYFTYSKWDEWPFTIALILASCATIRSFQKGVDAWLTYVPAAVITYMFVSFPLSANHHWFFLWAAFPVLMRPDLLRSEEYSQYVSVSMGVMMIMAVIQKLISGNFIDGSFMSYLAVHGSSSERLVEYLCYGTVTSENMTPCSNLVLLSRASLVWQAIIGVLLILHVRNKYVFGAEIIFLMTVGTMADEWIFQAINLCCIIFVMRYRVPVWFFFAIIPFALFGLMGVDYLMWFTGRIFS